MLAWHFRNAARRLRPDSVNAGARRVDRVPAARYIPGTFRDESATPAAPQISAILGQGIPGIFAAAARRQRSCWGTGI
jgi:hypothetical protein